MSVCRQRLQALGIDAAFPRAVLDARLADILLERLHGQAFGAAAETLRSLRTEFETDNWRRVIPKGTPRKRPK